MEAIVAPPRLAPAPAHWCRSRLGLTPSRPALRPVRRPRPYRSESRSGTDAEASLVDVNPPVDTDGTTAGHSGHDRTHIRSAARERVGRATPPTPARWESSTCPLTPRPTGRRR